jgi:YggT family protein
MLIEATTRGNIANYVQALFEVYIVLIFLYILLNLLLSFGMRLPYSRWSDMLINFLRDCSEPTCACSGSSSRRSARSTSHR